ncbi:hypothetical protein RRG08_020393 [Elysia crispata]|uniref:Uncharacterized protein n=1 Tax=Elysia crispata TaxID=231223 RepID=A0AAE1CTS5_9GAST|nr:hypothetical protein RRG08_020393 [Elysia crispata]
MNKNRAISLGIMGGLVIIGGVMMSVLLFFMVDVLKEGYREKEMADDENWKKFKENSYSPVWALGFAYIIPGVALFVAALIQNKAGYVISSIFSLLALLLMGIFVLMAGLFLIVFIVSIGVIEDHCRDTVNGCTCTIEDEYSSETESVTPFKECHYFSSFASLIVALFICIIVSWFLLLIAFIMAIYYSCRSSPNQPGTVYAPVQQPVFASGQDQSQYPPPSYTYQAQSKPMYLEGGSQAYYDGPPSKV